MKKQNYKNKNIFVFGMGRTGRAVSAFFQKKGAKIYFFDEKDDLFPESSHCIRIFSKYEIENIEFIFSVLSPGFDEKKSDVFEYVKSKNVEIFSEIELASSFAKGDIFAITGTNGKSTCASLLKNILSFSFRRVFLGGNIGLPFISFCEKVRKKDKVVLELSSYMLSQSHAFHPKFSCFLNLQPDHLNRHLTMENYRKAKEHIFQNQNESDFSVFFFDDEITNRASTQSKANVFFFSKKNAVRGSFSACDEIFFFDKNLEYVLNTDSVKLLGDGNLELVLACVCLSKIAGVKNKHIIRGISTFLPLPHRLEIFLQKNGITYVNDSKATNVDSTLFALSAFSEKVVLLLGGYDDGQDLARLFSPNCNNVKFYVFFGVSRKNLQKAKDRENNHIPFFSSENLEEATKITMEKAKEGDIVLFSPALKSFDEFSSFEERGEKFKELVNGKESQKS